MANSVTSIVTEALKRSGNLSPSNLEVTRATNEWYTEIADDVRRRKAWRKGINVLRDWRTAIINGIVWLKYKDDFDRKREGLLLVREAKINYENEITILMRIDNREVIKRNFKKLGGGMPTRNTI